MQCAYVSVSMYVCVCMYAYVRVFMRMCVCTYARVLFYEMYEVTRVLIPTYTHTTIPGWLLQRDRATHKRNSVCGCWDNEVGLQLH